MSNRPIQDWKQKGLSISVWANEHGNSYTVQKRWKDKATDEWKGHSIKLFPSELEILGQLLMCAVNFEQGGSQAETEKANAYAPEAPAVTNDWEDSEIPF